MNSFQNGFLKNKHTVASSVTHLDYVAPLVTIKCQEVVIYCDLSSEIDLFMHFIIFKLRAFGLLSGFWCRMYFPNYKSFVCISGILFSPYASWKICPGASLIWHFNKDFFSAIKYTSCQNLSLLIRLVFKFLMQSDVDWL